MAEIKAANNFVFLIREVSETERKGFYLPDQGVEKQHRGKVISVGKLTRDPLIKTSVGKIALFHKGIGFEIPYKETTYVVLTDDEIIGIE